TLDFRTASETVLQLAIGANGYLNENAPWKRMKTAGEEGRVGEDLYAVLETSRWVALLLAPLLPDLSSRLLDQLAQEPIDSTGDPHSSPTSWQLALHWGGLNPGLLLPEPVPVMQRLELDGPL
ncbi:MAG: methionine--tRNA ligase, partial [Synechococcaceae cyanobacterium ELA182]